MKIFILLILLTATIFASIGKITSLRGSCVVTRQSNNVDGYVGFELEEKDILNTKEDSKLQIIFKDETIVTIGKSSTFDIAEYLYDDTASDKSKVNFGFLNGSFKSITGRIGKIAPEKFKLKTKTATIGIRGTTIVGNQEKIACTQGKITVSSFGVTRFVPAGMFTKTPVGAPPTVPEPYTIGDIGEADVEQSSTGGAGTTDNNSATEEEKSTTTDKKATVEDEQKKSLQPVSQDLLKNTQDKTKIIQETVNNIKEVIDTDVKIKENKDQVVTPNPDVTPEPAGKSVNDIASEVLVTSTLDNAKIDTTGLTLVSAAKSSNFGTDYLDFGYWDKADASTAYSYVTGVVTSSDYVDQMIRNGGTAAYGGKISSIVTKTDGKTVSSGGDVNINFDFSKQKFSGNLNVVEGNFKAAIAGNVHKYGFDSTSVTTATGSSATGISGSVTGQFYGANAQAAGGKFDLKSANAGSVSGVFGVKNNGVLK